MPNGNKDFNQGQNAGVSGDLASRVVKGAGAYHPSGTWAFFEDFEGATPLNQFLQNANGGTIAVDSTKSYRGANSLKLVTPALLGTQANVQKTFPITTDNLGMDIMANFVPAAPATSEVTIGYYVYINIGQGIKQLQASVQVTYWGPSTTSFVDIISPDSPTRLSSTFPISWASDRWHNIKMILDIPNQRYKKLFIDNFEFDLSAYRIQNNGPTQNDPGEYVKISALALTNTATAETVNYDDLIVTFNE